MAQVGIVFFKGGPSISLLLCVCVLIVYIYINIRRDMHQPHMQIDPAVMFWIALISLILHLHTGLIMEQHLVRSIVIHNCLLVLTNSIEHII